MVNRVVDKTEHVADNEVPEEKRGRSIADWILGGGVGLVSTAAILFSLAAETPDHRLSAPAFFIMMAATLMLGSGGALKVEDTETKATKKDDSTYDRIRV